jgi:anthranilate/para-aminobenzoate synthase component II
MRQTCVSTGNSLRRRQNISTQATVFLPTPLNRVSSALIASSSSCLWRCNRATLLKLCACTNNSDAGHGTNIKAQQQLIHCQSSSSSQYGNLMYSRVHSPRSVSRVSSITCQQTPKHDCNKE